MELAAEDGVLYRIADRLDEIEVRLNSLAESIRFQGEIISLRPDAHYIMRVSPDLDDQELNDLQRGFAERGLDVVIIQADLVEVGRRGTSQV